jgi:glucose-1-phosphate thymidylyltransferase
MSELVGVIPAAGKGSRLAPFPCPKELFPVGYQEYSVRGTVERRPKVISQYLFEQMVGAGAKRIFIVLGEDKYDIMRYYGAGRRFDANVAYLYQDVARGMPFALDLVYPWLKGETVVFGMPDTIIEPRDAFARLVEHHRATGADLTLGIFPTDTPWKLSPVKLDDDGRVIYNVDKPRETELRNTWGIGCWGARFTELMHEFLTRVPLEDRETVLSDVFNQALLQKLRVQGVSFDDGQFLDIGTVEDLDIAQRRFHF